MARSNSKNETTTVRFRTIVKTFALGLLVAVVGLGLVHQHNLHHELADESKRLDAETRALEEKIRQAMRVEATLKSPPMLARRAAELRLELVPIQATQRVYLARTPLPTTMPAPMSTAQAPSPAPSPAQAQQGVPATLAVLPTR